jgi:hypothetical protein
VEKKSEIVRNAEGFSLKMIPTQGYRRYFHLMKSHGDENIIPG